MKWFTIAFLLIVLTLYIPVASPPSIAVAQTGQEPEQSDIALGSGISYQSQLRIGGELVNGACDFRFSLWNAATDGSRLGSVQSIPNLTVTAGQITVVINDGDEFGANAFVGSNRWLSTEIRCPAGIGDFALLQPRQRITATPQALYARRAGSVPWSGVTNAPPGFGAYWSLTGNAGINSQNFLGTSDDQPLELKVNNQRALRLEATAGAPNVIGGASSNGVFTTTIGSFSGGGDHNEASGNYSVVGGGQFNKTSQTSLPTYPWEPIVVEVGHYTVISGGYSNTVSSDYASVLGGASNQAHGQYSTIAGGYDNYTFGAYSFAAGRSAWGFCEGQFAWADAKGPSFPNSCAPNQFTARATGGVLFVTGIDQNGNYSSGAQIYSGSGSWSSISSRSAKRNFENVDTAQVLQEVVNLPIATWNYAAQDATIRHIGPMAEDFSAAFGVGEDEKQISSVDADGVALAAIQGVYELVKKQEQIIAQQQEQLDKALERIAQLEARLQSGSGSPTCQAPLASTAGR